MVNGRILKMNSNELGHWIEEGKKKVVDFFEKTKPVYHKNKTEHDEGIIKSKEEFKKGEQK